MFCRKCGKPILDDSTFCPECGADLSLTEPKKEDVIPVDMPEVTEDEKKPASKRKKLPIIIGAVVAVVAVAAILLLTGGDKGTFEGYAWDMTKAEVEKKVEKSTDWVVNTDADADEDELYYKGTYEGYTSLIFFEFDSNSTLESVTVYPINTSKEGASAAFETHKNKLQNAYGEAKTLPNVSGYAKWETDTSEITAMIIIDTIVAVTYKKVEPTE